MGLCSDTSWKRLQERRAERDAARVDALAAGARLRLSLRGLSATYEDRARDGSGSSPASRH